MTIDPQVTIIPTEVWNRLQQQIIKAVEEIAFLREKLKIPNPARDIANEHSELLAAKDKKIEGLCAALKRIINTQGCECDEYLGHVCLMCTVREIAEEALK